MDSEEFGKSGNIVKSVRKRGETNPLGSQGADQIENQKRQCQGSTDYRAARWCVAIVTAVHDYLLPSDSRPTLRRGVFAGLSLRARVMLLAVAGIVPMLAFSLGNQYLQYREAVANAGNQALELARSLSVVVDQELHARIVALQVFSASRAVQDNDLVTFRARAETVVAQQFPGSNVILLRQDGQQLMNTILPPGAPLHRVWRRILYGGDERGIARSRAVASARGCCRWCAPPGRSSQRAIA
jgi:hypothetical protein